MRGQRPNQKHMVFRWILLCSRTPRLVQLIRIMIKCGGEIVPVASWVEAIRSLRSVVPGDSRLSKNPIQLHQQPRSSLDQQVKSECYVLLERAGLQSQRWSLLKHTHQDCVAVLCYRANLVLKFNSASFSMVEICLSKETFGWCTYALRGGWKLPSGLCIHLSIWSTSRNPELGRLVES